MKNPVRGAALLVLVASLIGFGALTVLQTESEIRDDTSQVAQGDIGGQSQQQKFTPGVREDAALDTASESAVGPMQIGRAEADVRTQALGRVHSPTGGALAGIAVTWTPVSALSVWSSSALVSPDELDRVSLAVTSSAKGEFRLPDESMDGPGVVWLTGAGWLADSRLMSPEDWRAGTVDFVLAAGDSVEVRVVDEVGLPVAGARVREQGTRGAALSLRKSEDFYLQLQAFLREGVTDSNGRVDMPSGLAWARFQAFAHDGRVTAPVTQSPAGELELRLEDLVEIKGQVVGMDGLGPALVVVYVEGSGESRRLVETLDVLEDGTIAGRAVSRIEEGVYRLQLEGPKLVPQIVRVAPPRGLVLTVGFTAAAAAVVPMRFLNSEGDAVQGVRVRFNWDGEDGAVTWNAADVYSDQEGLVDLPSPPGYVFPSYSHPNYLSGYIDGLLATAEPSERQDVVLQPFASISGHVLQAGEPVSDFAIAYEGASQAGGVQVENINGQDDGAFSLAKIPTGDVTLFAYAEDQPQSEPETFTLLPGQTLEVDLVLPLGRSGHGLVFGADGVTPAGVVVDRFLRTGMGSDAVAQTPIPVGLDGRFQVSGLSASREHLLVQADGYSSAVAAAYRDPSGEYDFGTVVLEETSSITLDVLLPDGATPSEYSIRVSGGAYVGPLPVPQNQQVLVQPAKRGYTGVDLSTPNGAHLNFDFKFEGAGPWYRELDLRATGEVTVQLSGLDGEVPEGAWLSALAEATWSEKRLTVSSDVDGEMTVLKGLPRVPTSISFGMPGGVAVAWGVVTPGDPGAAVLELDVDVPQWEVRVVGSDGNPLQGIQVRVIDMKTKWSRSMSQTDEDGLAMAGPAPAGPVALVLTDLEGAKVTNLVVQPAEAQGVFEVEFDAGAELNLVVKDGSVPLEGLELWALDTVSLDNIAWPRVGLAGVWLVEHLSEGDYLLEPQSNYVWFERKAVHAGPQGAQETVQFRRKAGVRIAVKDAYGSPAEGVSVGLRSVEYDTDVAEWLGDGRGESATGLVTDANGEVIVSAVPRGVYSWSVGTQSGQVDAPALGVGLIDVTLKP